MNKQIKELAKQAGLEFTYDSTETPVRVFVEAWGEDLETFAELIIRKCARIYWSIDNGEQYDVYVKELKKQFKVK
jgi:hypothetical protein